MTHTLHLPSTDAEVYGGAHAEWLRDILERLPRLQCLIVNGVSFFDHASLLALRYPSLRWRSTHRGASPVYGLRLLDASGCINATPQGLADTLSRFQELVSVDLSHTHAARDRAVLSRLKHLPNLRTLNIRGLKLVDSDFEIVAMSIGTRARSLDISANHLTDLSIRYLVRYCLNDIAALPENLAERADGENGETPLSGGFEYSAVDHLDTYIQRKFTQGFTGSLAIERSNVIGVTHLYASLNNLTHDGISALLRTGALQVLDVGRLSSVHEQFGSFMVKGAQKMRTPAVELLTPTLAEYCSHRLTYLRINHTIVTKVGASDHTVLNAHNQSTDNIQSVWEANKQQSPVLTVNDRELQSKARRTNDIFLHPGMLPKLRTLVLSDVPTKTPQPMIAYRLIQFVKSCAEEAKMARTRAKSTYALPPGRSRMVAEREHALTLFALRRIVLEMTSTDLVVQRVHEPHVEQQRKSYTEDEDSEALWQAAAHDFSFFQEEEEAATARWENRDAGRLPLPTLEVTPRTSLPARGIPHLVDVLAEISKYRIPGKAAYQSAIENGNWDAVPEGHWTGDITIIRKPRDGQGRNMDQCRY